MGKNGIMIIVDDIFVKLRYINMKFELNVYHRNTSDHELIADLKNVANMLEKNTVTLEEYNEYGHFHSTTLTRRFGSWFKCLDLAGLVPSRSRIGISNEELFEEIENIWVKLGKQPSYTQMRDMTGFSMGTYEKRFGGWRNALKAFVNYINGDDSLVEVPRNSPENLQNIRMIEDDKHKTSRSINLRMRLLVLKRDNFKCCICGASPAKDPSVELQVDHIKPWSKGGETIIDNLQTLCSKCNIGKSNLDN